MLDINNPSANYIPPFSPVVGDSNSYQFNITLVNNGAAYDLTGCTVDIAIGKTDYTSVFNTMAVANATAGQVSYVLTTNDIASAGEADVEIVIYASGNVKLTTVRFSFTVREGILNEGSVTSTNDYSALTTALSQVNDAVGNLGTLNTANNNLQASISTANTTKTNLDNSNTTANATKSDLDTSNTTANTTKSALDTSNTNAQTTKSSLDASIAAGSLSNYVLKSDRAGEMCNMLCTTPPTGWLKRNGQLYSRTTYPSLWSFIQNSGFMISDTQWTTGTNDDKLKFSSGDGSTTFRVMDTRGMHIRDWDDGRGLDSGRAQGTYQADQVKTHTHPMTGGAGGTGTGWNWVGDGTNNIKNTEATGGTENTVKNASYMGLIHW